MSLTFHVNRLPGRHDSHHEISSIVLSEKKKHISPFATILLGTLMANYRLGNIYFFFLLGVLF